jgi:hypothetical protein
MSTPPSTMNEVTDCYWHMVDVLLTRRAAKRKRQTMVLTVGGLAGRPPIDKRCRSQHVQDALRCVTAFWPKCCSYASRLFLVLVMRHEWLSLKTPVK